MNPDDRLRELQDPDRWEGVRLPRAVPAHAPRTRVAPARAAQLIVAFSIAILAVAGIVVAFAAPHPPVPAASPTSSAPVSSPTTPPSDQPPAISVIPGPAHMYGPRTPPPVCTLAQLETESKQDGGGAAGSYIQAVYLHNVGADCLLPRDAVAVGGHVVELGMTGAASGFVLPEHADAAVLIAAAFTCQPSESVNVEESQPELPIALRLGGASGTMTARFPRTRCGFPSVSAELREPDGNVFPSELASLQATVSPGDTTSAGPFSYTATLTNTGKDALRLTSCPLATEVLSAGSTVVSRSLTLRCPVGATLQPDVPVMMTVSTTVPSKAEWTLQWFLGGGGATGAASTTCRLDRLQVSELEAGAGAGSWVQPVRVVNIGPACVLPVTAFSVGGRVARAAQPAHAAGFRLAAGSTVDLAVAAAATCPDGSPNIASVRSAGPYAKPVVLSLGGSLAEGLDRPFPHLSCEGPSVDTMR